MARSAVMLRQACRLIPFERSIPAGVQISAELVWRREGWLELSYGVPVSYTHLTLPTILLV